MEPYSSDDIKRKRRKKYFKKIPEEVPVDSVKLRSDKCYIIVSEEEKIIYSWRGLNSSVRERFITSKAAQDILGQKGLDFTIISLKEGEENPEFLRLIGNINLKRKKRKISNFLKKLRGTIPNVTSAVILSTEGFPFEYSLPEGIDETKMAAMTAALFSLSERSIIEMENGDFEELYIIGSKGHLLVMQAGPNMILIASTTKSSNDDIDDDDDDRYPYPYIFKPPEPPGD